MASIKPNPKLAYEMWCQEEGCDWVATVEEGEADSERAHAHSIALKHEAENRNHCTMVQESDAFCNGDSPGMRMCGKLECEEELQQWLKSFFEENGWTAIREVSPHTSDHRADLIVGHEEYGWYGIEAKYFQGDGMSKLAKAHHQIIKKYRGKKYLNRRITNWVLCPYFAGYNHPRSFNKRRQAYMKNKFSREFMCKHGVGFLDLDLSSVRLDFAYSDTRMKVPVGGPDGCRERYYEEVSVGRIDSFVEKKMCEYSYD